MGHQQAPLLLFMPGLSLFHVVEVKARALVVGGIEPEHAGKYFFRIPHPAEAPQAKTVAVKTAEERTVVCAAPGKETVKVLAEGEFSDLHPYVVVTDRGIGIAGEGEVAQMTVGVETAEIGNKDVHEHAARLPEVTRLFHIDRFEDRVGIGVVRIFPRKHLLHLIFGPHDLVLMIGFAHGSIGSSGSPQ